MQLRSSAGDSDAGRGGHGSGSGSSSSDDEERNSRGHRRQLKDLSPHTLSSPPHSP